MTELAPLPRGLAIYCPLSTAQADMIDNTIATLRGVGASIAVVMVEGLPFAGGHGQPVTPRLAVARFASSAARLRASGIEPVACSFPALDGDLEESRAHLAACAAEAQTHRQLDAEPYKGAHWSPGLLAPWLADDPDLSITSTRAELPHLGVHRRETWLQLEQLDSTDTLAGAVTIATRFTPLERVVPVVGVFDTSAAERAPSMIRRDLDRCGELAKRSGRLAAWSSRAISREKGLTLRAWVESRPFG